MTTLLETSRPVEESPLVGHSIDLPVAGEPCDGYHLLLRGWALGRSGPPQQFEIGRGRLPAFRLAPNRVRPDLAIAFPDIPGAERSGFETRISLIGLPSEFEIRVSAVFDGTPIEIGVVDGRRSPLRLPPPTPGPMPVLMTTLGRSGSMWLGHLLAQHPAILAYRPFQLEPRTVGYWSAVLRSLSEPSSFLQVLGSVQGVAHWWLGDPGAPQVGLSSLEHDVSLGLSGTSVEMTAAFCRLQIQAFYASIPGFDRSARWFVEKATLDTADLCGELFPSTRELVLVRDFRDMIPSVISFNRKRGFDSFGRELVESDLDFVDEVRDRAIALLDCWRDRRGTAHLVRYEDLIVDPEATLTGILSYLDVDASPETVAAVLTGAETTGRELQAGHRTSSDPTASIGRWRRDLSPELQQACEEAFADLLPEFGYATGR
jgi:hypothetical protein